MKFPHAGKTPGSGFRQDFDAAALTIRAGRRLPP